MADGQPVGRLQPRGRILTYINIEKVFYKIPIALLLIAERFIKGDHWQNWLGWIGWKPEVDSRNYFEDRNYIHNGFTSKNVCGGIVKRLEGAVFGKEPDCRVVAKTDTTNPDAVNPNENYFKEVDAALFKWWADKKVHHYLKEFIKNRASYGKAGMRIYIPKGLLKGVTLADGTTESQVTGKSFEEVLNNIFIDVPHYSAVINEKDPNFGNEFTVVELPKIASYDVVGDTLNRQFEVCYIGEDKKTYIRQIIGSTNQVNEISIDLGGNLTTFVDGEYCERLISSSVISMQKQVNHAKTMEGYSLQGINFPETVFLNATIDEKDLSVAGRFLQNVKAIFRGYGRWMNLKGITLDKMDGEAYSPADVKWRTPADPDKFARVATNNEKDMHGEAGMLYVFLADSEYASGNSKIEAMTDYIILLVDSKTVGDALLTWLMETVVRLVHQFTNKSDLNNEFRVIASTKLTLGRMSVQEKTQMLNEVNAGLRSKFNYMIKAEVTDDPTSELTIVKVEQTEAEKLAMDKLKATTAVTTKSQIEVANSKPSPVPNTPPVTGNP